MEEIRLRLLWSIGQLVATLGEILMRCGHAITRLAYRLHDWAQQR